MRRSFEVRALPDPASVMKYCLTLAALWVDFLRNLFYERRESGKRERFLLHTQATVSFNCPGLR